MNFFETTCQEPTIDKSIFGLCDDQNRTKAYTNIDDQTKCRRSAQALSRIRIKLFIIFSQQFKQFQLVLIPV